MAVAKAAYKYSGAQDVVSCVTHPQLSSCLKAALTVALVVGTGGEGEAEVAALDAAEQAGAHATEEVGAATRAFAHGTSPESAANIAENGLSESAARAEAAGGRFATRGSFHTVEINPSNPGEALNAAMGYGFLKSAAPNIVVSELPEGIFQDMVGRGLATVEKVPGLGEQSPIYSSTTAAGIRGFTYLTTSPTRAAST